MKQGRTDGNATAPHSPKPEKNGAQGKTEKQRLQERLKKAGVIGVEKMTKEKLRSELARIKSEGMDVPDLRQENGGAPTSLSKDPKVTEMRNHHMMEDVEVTVRDRKTNEIKSSKKATMLAILDMLRHEALQNKSIPAAREYFDRTLGKAKQEIEHSGEIKVDEQRVPSKEEREAAQAFRKALEKGRGQ